MRLAIYCLDSGLDQADVIRDALLDYLKAKGA